MPSARTTIEINIQGVASYHVSVGASLGSVRRDALEPFAGKRLIVTDTNVAPHHLETALQDCDASSSVVLPAGEQHKTTDAMVEVVRAAANAGLDRGSVIIALGGGVIGDVAGLAAALFMRGIAFVNLPTTLLSMVDASIGGKTGVDLPEGKNLLGAFHQPRAVISDVAMLDSLPEAEWRHGMAEVIKTAIIGDAPLLDLLEQHTLDSIRHDHGLAVQIVQRCAEVKAGVVMRDVFESGERMQLNAGHTVGHALEAASSFNLAHGAAVAIGLVQEARLAELVGQPVADGFVARLTAVCKRYGLPTVPDPTMIDAALPRLRFDKKRLSGKARYALPVAPGRVELVEHIDETLVERILRG